MHILHSIIDKIRLSLHVSISTLFLVLLLISAGTLTWFNFTKNSDAALEIADSLLGEVNAKVMERIDEMLADTFQLALEATELPQIANKPEFMRYDIQWFLAESLLTKPHIYSVYVGFQDGDFYQIISLVKASDALLEKLGAPEGAELAIRNVFPRPGDGRRIELWQFLDCGRKMVGSRVERESTYDPRQRPWFQTAKDVEGVTHTPFYVFTSTGSMGMTVARRFDGPVSGVFGVDITLNELSKFFARQKVGKSGIVFMFSSEGYLTAYPDSTKTVHLHSYRMGQSLEQVTLDSSGEPVPMALSKVLGLNGIQEKLKLQVGKQSYLMRINPVSDTRLGKQYVAVAAPTAEFTSSMDQIRNKSLLFALGICLVAIPIAVHFSRMISMPLRQLVTEAHEIRRFNLEASVDIHSPISEIADLTKAVKTMKSSLSSFGRYVPRALVRQLLLSNLPPDIGGERREVTLLFTDVVDFTTISERMKPEELTRSMSDYLQAVGGELLKLDGTIDKFIGDGVMAFWNAPVWQDDHAERACEAALRARRENQILNDKWAAEGVASFRTRFGLHTGEAVIGNVGSDDRMDYTAIGASVNLASRLEGLNKYYGTEILASESVREQAKKRFVFRSVGKVMPKGTTIPVMVYELLGCRPGECDEDITVTHEFFEVADKWEEAVAAYHERRFEDTGRMFSNLADILQGDGLAVRMKERVFELLMDPPGDDWDGVDIFKTK